MACIKTRGPKNATRYYASYDVGRTAGGKRVMRMHLLKGGGRIGRANGGRVYHLDGLSIALGLVVVVCEPVRKHDSHAI